MKIEESVKIFVQNKDLQTVFQVVRMKPNIV